MRDTAHIKKSHTHQNYAVSKAHKFAYILTHTRFFRISQLTTQQIPVSLFQPTFFTAERPCFHQLTPAAAQGD